MKQAISEYRDCNHFEQLSKGFKVVAYPHRYYGGGAWGESPNPQYIDQAGDDVAAMVKALNAGPAHIVGWSMGGRVAHMAALETQQC